jgi:hypothetical protein
MATAATVVTVEPGLQDLWPCPCGDRVSPDLVPDGLLLGALWGYVRVRQVLRPVHGAHGRLRRGDPGRGAKNHVPAQDSAKEGGVSMKDSMPGDTAWALSLGWALMFSFIIINSACRNVPSPTKTVTLIPKVIQKTVPLVIPCMAAPPKMVVISWPDADRMGNRILAASTVDLIVDTMVAERRYIDENWAACQDAALEHEIWKEQK